MELVRGVEQHEPPPFGESIQSTTNQTPARFMHAGVFSRVGHTSAFEGRGTNLSKWLLCHYLAT